VLHQQRFELLAPLYQHLERASLDTQAVVERQTLEVDTVAGQQLHVRVVDKADAVQVDHAKVWRVCFDLADVDYFVDLFCLLVRQFKRSCVTSQTLLALNDSRKIIFTPGLLVPSVCLFVLSITQKRIIPKWSNSVH